MTVFGSGYRALDYEPTSALRRWLAIALIELRATFRNRRSTILFLWCQTPGFMSLVLLLVWSGFWQFGNRPGGGMGAGGMGRAGPEDIEFYLASVTSPQAFLTITTLVAFTISRAIARDRASQALEILWTRGVTPLGYFTGKVMGAAMVLGIGGLLVPLVLWLFAWANAPTDAFLAETARFLPRLAAALAFHTFAVATFAVSVSSFARTANSASIAWVILMVGGSAFAGVAQRLARGAPTLRTSSPWDVIRRATESIAGVEPRAEFPAATAWIAFGVFAAAAVILVLRRLRMQEAIG